MTETAQQKKPMTKKEFIKEIIAGFPSSFKKSDIEVEMRKYDVAIEENLDYDKLYECFLKDWRYKTAPNPAYFQQFFNQCRNRMALINMPSERRKALVKVANWYNSTAYQWWHKSPPPEIYSLRKKYGLTDDEVNFAMFSGELGEE